MLLHVIYALLEFDKIYLCAKNLHQDKHRALFDDFSMQPPCSVRGD